MNFQVYNIKYDRIKNMTYFILYIYPNYTKSTSP